LDVDLLPMCPDETVTHVGGSYKATANPHARTEPVSIEPPSKIAPARRHPPSPTNRWHAKG
jgi:hypothetical protein